MLGQTADYAAYGPDGQLALIAEIKNKPHTTREWASQLRRNMLTHGSMPQNAFFLLALPDRFYLWKNGGNVASDAEPTYEIDPTASLRSYYERIGLTPDTITNGTFELIVTFILNNIMYGLSSIDERNPIVKAFCDSGLMQALAGGTTAIEVAV